MWTPIEEELELVASHNTWNNNENQFEIACFCINVTFIVRQCFSFYTDKFILENCVYILH